MVTVALLATMVPVDYQCCQWLFNDDNGHTLATVVPMDQVIDATVTFDTIVAIVANDALF